MLTDEVMTQAHQKFRHCMTKVEMTDFLERMQDKIDQGEITISLQELIAKIKIYDGVDEWFEDNIDMILSGVEECYQEVVAGAINIMDLKNRMVRANIAILELHNGYLLAYSLPVKKKNVQSQNMNTA